MLEGRAKGEDAHCPLSSSLMYEEGGGVKGRGEVREGNISDLITSVDMS